MRSSIYYNILGHTHSFDRESAGPADVDPSGTLYLSAEITAKLAADLASRTGDSSDEEVDTFGADGDDSD
jgi:hypothetical protein